MADNIKILIVDDEADFAKGLSRLISSDLPNLEIHMAHNGNEAMRSMEAAQASVILLDLNMPGISGMDIIPAIRAKYPDTTIIVLTAYGTVAAAVLAIKQGAWDFLTKPVRRDELVHAISMAIEHSKLLGENQKLKQIMAQSGIERVLIGDSPAMRCLKERVAAVAASSYTVLVNGESGTGKELVAEAIHKLSDRNEQPFIRVNCPAIPEQLLESELFGHVKGSFTGAVSAYKGLFVQAAGGTLLLDEVGDIPMSIQTKLLRVLQDGEVRPVGSAKSVRVDTRIIAATNQNLEGKIKDGTFRDDLYYRLNVLSIETPPLRERRADIPLLAIHFLAQTCQEMGIPPKRISPEAMLLISEQDWPGNVRELQNFIRRITVFAAGEVILLEDVRLSGVYSADAPGIETGGKEKEDTQPYKRLKSRLLETFTRSYMQDLLRKTGGNISEAARLSGLERVSLQKILRRLGIDGAGFRKP